MEEEVADDRGAPVATRARAMFLEDGRTLPEIPRLQQGAAKKSRLAGG